MRGKVIASALLTVVLGCSSVYGSDAFDNMSTSEQAQTAGVYLEEIIKDIQNTTMVEMLQQTSWFRLL